MNGQLTAEEQRMATRLRLDERDTTRCIEIKGEVEGVIDPWFVLGLEKGWLRGDVAIDGESSWKGAVLLGIEPQEKDPIAANPNALRRLRELMEIGMEVSWAHEIVSFEFGICKGDKIEIGDDETPWEGLRTSR